MTHSLAAKVLVVPCFTILCSYDDGFKVTSGLHFATKELATKICEKLNGESRKWGGLSFVEGHEYCKNFITAEAFSDKEDSIYTDFDTALGEMKEEFYNEELDCKWGAGFRKKEHELLPRSRRLLLLFLLP